MKTQQFYPTGTIITCPEDGCGLGLYRIVEAASFEDLVVFDDIRLRPLNDTIPAHDVWQVLACPFCGSRLLKEGKIHTLQSGWV